MRRALPVVPLILFGQLILTEQLVLAQPGVS